MCFSGANISEKRSGTDDGGTEGPERGMEARSAGAPRGWGLGRDAVAPPQYGGPQKIFSKINIKIAYFSAFLQAEIYGLFCSGVKAGLDNRK